MNQKLQFKNQNTNFNQFGKILFVFACFYVIFQAIIYISENFYLTHDFAYEAVKLSFSICIIALLFLLFYNSQKIKKEFPSDRNLTGFSIGLLIWIIFYIIFAILPWIGFLVSNSPHLYGDVILAGYVSYFFMYIFQFIAWNSLRSFFKKSTNLFSPITIKQVDTTCKLLAITAILGALINISYVIILMNYSLILDIIWYILFIGIAISFAILYIILSINLRKKNFQPENES